MISIVVCSINTELLNRFKDNLAATINSIYEIIVFDNIILNKSISEIYNTGTAVAKYDIIAFCHEDIIFNSFNWEIVLEQLFKDNKIGLIGVAGAVYKSSTPTSWVSIPNKYYRVNMYQKSQDDSLDLHMLSTENAQVAVLDGCFIAGRKEIFQQFQWNSNLLKGFHLYDLDISLRVGKFYKLYVTKDILITHLSEGNFNETWLKESELFHKYYKNEFPLSVSILPDKEVKALKYFTLNSHVHTLIKLKQPFQKIIFYYLKMIYLYPFELNNLILLKLIVKQN